MEIIESIVSPRSQSIKAVPLLFQQSLKIYNTPLKEGKYKFIDKLNFYQKHNLLPKIELHDRLDLSDKEVVNFIRKLDDHTGLDPNHILMVCKRLLNEKVDLIEMHFKYAPGEVGCREAKKDFYSRISS